MSDEIEKASDEKESQTRESKNLGQDEISKLIDEIQSGENSSETKEQTEKTTDTETKQHAGETTDAESETRESNNLNQDDVSQLIDKVQTKENSSETGEEKDTTGPVENDNEGKKSTDSKMPDDENRQALEGNNNNANKRELEERVKSRENDEKLIEGDQKSAKENDTNNKREENDKEDDDRFNGLDSDNEVEIDGNADNPPDTGKIESENEGDKHKKTKNDEDQGLKTILNQVKKKPKGKKLKVYLSCISSVAIIVILLGVYAIFPKSAAEGINAEKPVKTKKVAKQGNKYSAKLDEITRLRKKLLIKEKEIADLIKNYKNGISKMENEIVRVKQNHQINSFNTAIKNKKIEFGILTIQRRLAYIKKINTPYKWINQGIEELLYLKHKIEIDAQISRVISGIDMDQMIQEIDVVIQSYRSGMEKLEIDMKNVELMPLETIWERIIEKDQFTSGNNNQSDEPAPITQKALAAKEKINRMIWEEICNGNFQRKNEITTLSTEAAKCLSKWKHADLFLNGISEISPEAAKYLLKWKGNWICLNGVKTLSAETAKHLFQWQGNWISLNGLGEISSGMTRYLPQWQGNQLELMGLKYKKSQSERAGLRSLARWEKSGGKLYIPVQIRKLMNKL
ncbi:MAG: hypothetical protein SWH54_17230 [Thermodesulfobacteriota bacterium]|nr:hypothetical protein [Thermodesulfobacteriota bacterium]